jgi:rubredoxin
MGLFGAKLKCQACGSTKVEQLDSYWVCRSCAANGGVLKDRRIYTRIHGRPRYGEGAMAEVIDPSVLAQLAVISPSLQAATADPVLARQFDDVAQRVTWHISATAFEMEDVDGAEASAVWTQQLLGGTVRRDEMPFFVVTAAVDWGWNWRIFEFGDGAIGLGDVVDWVDSRLPLGTMSRSERMSVIAQNFCVDRDELAASTIGLPAHGEAVLEAAFLVCRAWSVDTLPNGRPHGMDLSVLRQAFEFGIALRTSALALDTYDAVSAPTTVTDEQSPIAAPPLEEPHSGCAPSERACPDCAEIIKGEARVCRFCGHRLAPPP